MKHKRSILYSIITFIVGFIYAFYVEPKPIASIGHIGLIIAQTIGYMLAGFVLGAIILLILMIFIKRIKQEFWNLATLIMMGAVILFILADLFL
jgi:hypothetical protein